MWVSLGFRVPHIDRCQMHWEPFYDLAQTPFDLHRIPLTQPTMFSLKIPKTQIRQVIEYRTTSWGFRAIIFVAPVVRCVHSSKGPHRGRKGSTGRVSCPRRGVGKSYRWRSNYSTPLWEPINRKIGLKEEIRKEVFAIQIVWLCRFGFNYHD